MSLEKIMEKASGFVQLSSQMKLNELKRIGFSEGLTAKEVELIYKKAGERYLEIHGLPTDEDQLYQLLTFQQTITSKYIRQENFDKEWGYDGTN